ncbi:hypothetical protein R1flu_001592 [Riccia fluitans]|uniref:Uncharacterized protein n=1 Tax=Riccia fluitans TaxID=41844 RepID=A0ABD1Y3R0_9MARC
MLQIKMVEQRRKKKGKNKKNKKSLTPRGGGGGLLDLELCEEIWNPEGEWGMVNTFRCKEEGHVLIRRTVNRLESKPCNDLADEQQLRQLSVQLSLYLEPALRNFNETKSYRQTLQEKMEGDKGSPTKALARDPLDNQSQLGRRATLAGFLPGAEENEKIEAERNASLGFGIHFYPDTNISRVGEFKDEEECIQDNDRFQPSGLDPTMIFKKVEDNIAPEQNITLFALRLALIEKAASGIGTLSFIWASTIILGGFASNINPSDFLVVTIILITEGTRIFTRSRELEWQHVTSKSIESLKFHRSKSDQNSKTSLIPHHHQQQNDEQIKVQDGSPPRENSSPTREIINPPSRKKSTTSKEGGDEGNLDQVERGSSLPSITVRVEKPPDEKTMAPLEAVVEEEKNDSSSCMYPRFRNPWGGAAGDKSENLERQKIQKSLLGSLSVKNAKRTWTTQVVPMIPCGFHSIISTRGVSSLFYWTQLASAIICLILSGWRVSVQNYNPSDVQPGDTPVNLFWSVNIFYALALTEATLFLFERGYWEWKLSVRNILAEVSERCGLGDDIQDLTKQFFYEVYKKCIEGSVFDGLDMDFVEYSLNLLQSDNPFEQLGGAGILRRIIDQYDGFAADALRRIETSTNVIERLVKMLSWRSPNQDEIRKEVAALICRVARYSKNCFRIAAVPGSMEVIVALLKCSEPTNEGVIANDEFISNYALTLRLDGLRILVALSKDSSNLLKIGETRGLVPILVSFISVKDRQKLKTLEGTELKVFKKSMRLLALLAAARNDSGNTLRNAIARVVSSIANLRDILEEGDSNPQLQWMAIEILTNLALDDSIRRAIGSTGGVIRVLFHIHTRHLRFMRLGDAFPSEEQLRISMAVSKRAGDALNLLAIQSSKNSLRMIDLKNDKGDRPFVPSLLELLNEHREHAICAAKILRSLMEYGGDEIKKEISVCSPRIVKLVMESRSPKMQEAVVGLAPRIVAVLDTRTYDDIFRTVDKPKLVQQLLSNLEHNSQASSKFPRIRRHSIEFIVVLCRKDRFFLDKFRECGVERRLEQAMETISEVENFVLFSGAEGLSRHSISMEDLIQRSLVEIRKQTQRQENQETFHFGAPQYP